MIKYINLKIYESLKLKSTSYNLRTGRNCRQSQIFNVSSHNLTIEGLLQVFLESQTSLKCIWNPWKAIDLALTYKWISLVKQLPKVVLSRIPFWLIIKKTFHILCVLLGNQYLYLVLVFSCTFFYVLQTIQQLGEFMD